MKLIISPEDFRYKCLYCKKPLSVKYLSHEVDDDLSEIIFFDSHKICQRRAVEIAILKTEINEQEKNLIKLRRRLTTLETKEAFEAANIH